MIKRLLLLLTLILTFGAGCRTSRSIEAATIGDLEINFSFGTNEPIHERLKALSGRHILMVSEILVYQGEVIWTPMGKKGNGYFVGTLDWELALNSDLTCTGLIIGNKLINFSRPKQFIPDTKYLVTYSQFSEMGKPGSKTKLLTILMWDKQGSGYYIQQAKE